MSEFLQILENHAGAYRLRSRFFIVEAARPPESASTSPQGLVMPDAREAVCAVAAMDAEAGGASRGDMPQA